MRNIFSYLTILVFSLVFLSSCEDVVDVDFPQSETTYINIDALIDNIPQKQSIRISRAGSFINEVQEPIENAQVSINLNNKTFNFSHEGQGLYSWTPDTNNYIDSTVGEVATLNVSIGNTTYTATSEIKRVPNIDSLTVENYIASFTQQPVTSIMFWAQDLPNGTDYYWIKGFRNNEPQEELGNIAIDGAFDENSADGFIFIPPLREFLEVEEGDDTDSSFVNGEELRVELHSIEEGLYEVLSSAEELLDNGGLFAVPYFDLPSNINSSVDGEIVLGWFSVSNGRTEMMIYEE